MSHRNRVLKEVVARIGQPLFDCVAEVGCARGSTDAPAIVAAATPVQAHELAWLCRYGFQRGELAAWICAAGLIDSVQLFAPNASGFWPTYITHTAGMLLTGAELRLLDAAGYTVAHVRDSLGTMPADALMAGWETAVCQHLTSLSTSALETTR